MAYLKKIITGVVNGKCELPQKAIQAQRLASCMAWQILFDYPTRHKPKEWNIYKNLRGVMLADEVGGGKTFETLSIISKALLEQKKNPSDKRKYFRKVLIVANPSIRSKWEWKEKEDLSFEEFNSENYTPLCDIGKFIKQTKIDKPSTQKLFDFFSKQTQIKSKKDWLDFEKSNQGIWLTSFTVMPKTKGSSFKSEFIKNKSRKAVFPKNYFDWIIVDEAHSLKSGTKDVDENLALSGAAIRKIYATIKASKGARILLLTATPFQNNKSELLHLLSMLENIETKNDPTTITGLIALGIKALENEFAKLKTDKFSIDTIKMLYHKFNNEINDLLNYSEEDKITRPSALKIGGANNGLDDYLRDIMIRNTKESLIIEPVIASLNESEKFQYLLYRDLIKTSKEESQMFSTKLSQLVSSRDSFSDNINHVQNTSIEKLFGGNLVFEAKYKKLLEKIEEIEISNGKNVITVFVSWLGTIETLKRRMKKEYKVFELTSQTKPDERNKKLKEIKTANDIAIEKIILIASRVGNEGLDFDKFSNRVIHYDNNFNPAIIDQRNGRVYRGSNIKASRKKVAPKDIQIFQLFIEESYDQRILFIEQEKRKMKNFYLGDGALDQVLMKTIEKNNIKEEDEIFKIMESIKIDLSPHKKFILSKYKKEL